ncbi:uracil-xanthine permease family protein [Actinobacillus equuli subsp. haemolyticus]|uniref:Uracil permease n=1 Tax=Actinobacillus equuli TaxID=718 RepID=A0AAX3FHE4_ACTEU|nr:uracil-xanthine permease family protein [Actinobacillus equuli]AIZ79489.1 uracil transporter [Actinobacillus equuli subsp. equuli]MDG4952728.1 uracil-xanthine permease family protein [Actinobacillus equuli subsp. equuli]WGE43603.1 uracil-xanthine permease family protein [Actinobacillus equuli subsp. equuli]WGE47864.1 uracil-xanthine permease family protein [Actinobacillus equuli subsp. equuli]WGE49962.1 uracil-xanthine permease family protein [Actinobacillus equuli subsp. haemolyticus]
MTNQTISTPKQVFVGLQMLFVAFGALVLMPLITGLDPNTALLTAGIGTLLFQLCTKGQVPIFLASSFAFIAPIQYGVQQWGIPTTMGGLVFTGFVYFVLSSLVKWKGANILEKLFPPVVVGPVIIIIGLGLAPTAVDMALGKGTTIEPNTALLISMATLITTLIVAVFAKGLMKLVPIMFGIVVGYILSLVFGIIDFSPVTNAAWFSLPKLTTPEFKLEAILYLLPIALAPAVEHVGGIMAISSVTGKDFMNKPGLHRTLLGDGVATSAAAFLGGPPNTTYAEVTGAVMLTKNFNPRVMTFAAIWAIAISFCGKVGAFLQTIPGVVMGGIMMLVFGSIAAVGMSTLIRAKVDMGEARNLCIVSVVMTFGIGGMLINVGEFSLKGISLCAIAAIVMNLLLPKEAAKKAE